jgi:hypothetical protein
MSQEPMLFNVTLAKGPMPWHSEWMPGTTYSEVICKCLMKWPGTTKNDFIVEATGQTWASFIKDTQSWRFE